VYEATKIVITALSVRQCSNI